MLLQGTVTELIQSWWWWKSLLRSGPNSAPKTWPSHTLMLTRSKFCMTYYVIQFDSFLILPDKTRVKIHAQTMTVRSATFGCLSHIHIYINTDATRGLVLTVSIHKKISCTHRPTENNLLLSQARVSFSKANLFHFLPVFRSWFMPFSNCYSGFDHSEWKIFIFILCTRQSLEITRPYTRPT